MIGVRIQWERCLHFICTRTMHVGCALSYARLRHPTNTVHGELEHTSGPWSSRASALAAASGLGRCATSRSRRPASAASGFSCAVRASMVCAATRAHVSTSRYRLLMGRDRAVTCMGEATCWPDGENMTLQRSTLDLQGHSKLQLLKQEVISHIWEKPNHANLTKHMAGVAEPVRFPGMLITSYRAPEQTTCVLALPIRCLQV